MPEHRRIDQLVEKEKLGVQIPIRDMAILSEARKRKLIPEVVELSPPVIRDAQTRLLARPPAIPQTRGGVVEEDEPISKVIFEEAPAIGGMMIGGAIGAVVGGPPGAILGSTLGGAAGEAGKILGQAAGVFPGKVPAGGVEATEQIAKQATFGLFSEVGGQGALKAATKIAAPFAKTFTKEGREAVEFLDELNRTMLKNDPFFDPILISPAKATESRFLDIAENAVEASMFGGQSIREMRILAEEAIDKQILKFTEQIVDVDRKPAIIELMKRASQNRLDLHRVFRQKAYDRVDLLNKFETKIVKKKIGQEASGTFDETGRPVMIDKFTDEVVFTKGGVDITDVKARILKESSSEGVDPANPLGSGPLVSMNESIQLLPNKITFGAARKLKTQINQGAFKGTEIITESDKGVQKVLAVMVEGDMEKSSLKLSPSAFKVYQKASRIAALGRERFNSMMMKAVLESTKETKTIYNMFVKDGGAKTIREARNTVRRDPEIWPKVQGEFIADVLDKATDETGFIKGKVMTGLVKKFDTSGTGALQELFPKFVKGSRERIDFFKKVGRIKDTIIRRQPDATGRLAFQFGQIAAISGAARGVVRTESLFILLAPLGLAKVFKSPRAVKFLTEGYHIGGKTGIGISAAAKFSSILLAEGIEHEMAPVPKDESPKLLQGLERFKTQQAIPQ